MRVNNEEILPEYLLYWMKGPYFQKYLKSVQGGSAQGFLSLELIRSLPVKYPSIAIQKQIISTLSDYDNLVINNNQRIYLLEEMAEEIYKEWFVRMRFPNYRNTKFFDKDGKEVSFDTKKAIPEEWKETCLDEVCSFQMGQSPKSEFYNNNKEGLPFHQGVTNFGNRFPSHPTYCTDFKRLAERGDILMSVRAPVGRINIANKTLIIGRGLCSIRSKISFQNYCFYFLKNIFIKEDSYGNGAVFNSVSKNDLLRIKILKPSFKTCEKFQVMVKPIDDEIEILTEKNEILKQTRDLLLPRLISGKLNIEQLTTI